MTAISVVLSSAFGGFGALCAVALDLGMGAALMVWLVSGTLGLVPALRDGLQAGPGRHQTL